MQGQRECQKQYWFHKEEDKINCKGKENGETWSTRPTFAGSVPDLLLIPLWFNVRGSADPIPRKWSQFRSQSAHFNCATFTKIHFFFKAKYVCQSLNISFSIFSITFTTNASKPKNSWLSPWDQRKSCCAFYCFLDFYEAWLFWVKTHLYLFYHGPMTRLWTTLLLPSQNERWHHFIVPSEAFWPLSYISRKTENIS